MKKTNFFKFMVHHKVTKEMFPNMIFKISQKDDKLLCHYNVNQFKEKSFKILWFTFQRNEKWIPFTHYPNNPQFCVIMEFRSITEIYLMLDTFKKCIPVDILSEPIFITPD
jgi:hypothetical protein